MRAGWVLGLLLLLAFPAAARQVSVQSGEHGYFSRIVVELGPSDDWSFGRSGKDYVLTFAAANMTAEIGRVFTQIPRTRLTDLVARPDGAGLVLRVAEGTHAVAFRAEGGQAVIDILDGPPPEGSPFEVEITAAAPEKPQAKPLPHPGQTVTPATAGSGAATLAYRPEANSAASLPIYWRDVLPGGVPAQAPTPEPAVANETAEAAEPTEPVQPEAAASQGKAASVDLPLTAEAEPPLLPALPDPSVLAVENELRLQIARAAAQGLAQVAEEGFAKAGIADELEAKREAERSGEAGGETMAGADATGSEEVPFHAETSMDRDGRDNPMARHVTDLGDECLPGDLFDVASWGTPDEPPERQITAARTGLSGEFDRPDPAAAKRLARLYLHFGMGAEAAQVSRAFGLTGPEAVAIQDLGLIMEGATLPDGGALRDYAECNTPVALWAFLGAPAEPPMKNANVAAITRAFSALPPPLRHLLGQRLSDRLIGIGALDEARAVRNAVARKPEGGERALEMMDADIALAEGAHDEAVEGLDALVEGTDALSEEALVKAVSTRLKAGEPIDPAQAEALAALAFERRHGSEGDALAHLDILAQAHSGALSEAFRRFRDWRAERPDADHRATAQGLFAALAGIERDETFLTAFFRERDLLDAAEPGEDLRLGLAERLARLGFAGEVRDLMIGLPGETERGRIALAQAALAVFDAAEVLRLTEGIEGPEAKALRAAALELEGDHLAAAAAFGDLGDKAAQARAAWAGGDLSQAAAGSADLEAVVARLDLGAPTNDPAEGVRQTLAESTALLQGSAEFRAALGELMAGDILLQAPTTEAADAAATPEASPGN